MAPPAMLALSLLSIRWGRKEAEYLRERYDMGEVNAEEHWLRGGTRTGPAAEYGEVSGN
jgi:hypothetical protein